jgi:phospho-N-acetylmuramoyl-pentapeptide-transferase
MILDIVKVFVPSTLAFAMGMLLTPVLTHFLYKYRLWKKKPKSVALDGGGTPVFAELHKEKEVGTPRMGGIIIWASAALVTLGLWASSRFFAGTDIGALFAKLDFLSRDQTWIPLLTLLLGAFVGLIDDIAEVRGSGSHIAGGLSLKKRLAVVGMAALLVGLWFYIKLDIASIGLPFLGDIYIGWLFVPFFILVAVALYSGGVIDGIDGLAGGIFASIFAAYAGIAFYQDQINLAAFCAVLVGGILSFLWFNIPPARFYMSETGSMALTITLAIVAFMTDTLGEGHGIIALPIIAFPLFATSFSNIIQVASKRFRAGKKVFRIAPIHHHFEAVGWPSYKVTMRYWIIGVIFAIIGLIVGLVG